MGMQLYGIQWFPTVGPTKDWALHCHQVTPAVNLKRGCNGSWLVTTRSCSMGNVAMNGILASSVMKVLMIPDLLSTSFRKKLSSNSNGLTSAAHRSENRERQSSEDVLNTSLRIQTGLVIDKPKLCLTSMQSSRQVP